MVKIKHKRKSTREPQLSANLISSRKRGKQDVVHGVVETFLEIKSRGDVYGIVKKIIDDAIAVIPWMIGDSLNCAARRHKQKISNNQIIDKEESETHKSEHQTSVLGILSTTNVNGGIPKLSALKNKKNIQARMD